MHGCKVPEEELGLTPFSGERVRRLVPSGDSVFEVDRTHHSDGRVTSVPHRASLLSHALKIGEARIPDMVSCQESLDTGEAGVADRAAAAGRDPLSRNSSRKALSITTQNNGT
jgi:hypothetical protein